MMEITVVIKNDRGESRHSLSIEPFRTVLDVLETIKALGKPDLIYRHSCHHGSCGTCGALLNGKPRLMCLARIGDFEGGEIIVEPLKKMMQLEGVAVWPGSFFDTLPETDYLRTAGDENAVRPLRTADSAFRERPDMEKQPMRLEDCIECGLCVAACPVDRGFVGPAALAAAEIELGKNPDRRAEMLTFAARPEGAPGCERFFECSRVCPRDVSPGRRITGLLKLLKQ